MKHISITLLTLSLSSLVAQAVVIDIDGAAFEFADYSSLAKYDVWGPSSQTDGDYTLSVLNEGVILWAGTAVAGSKIYTQQSNEPLVANASSDISASAAEAITEDRFITLQISSSADAFDLNSISVDFYRNGSGAAEFYQFAYDDEGTGFDAGDLLGTETDASGTGSSSPYTIVFSGAALPDAVTTVDVRLYFWGGTSGNGPTHFTKVAANVTTIPEPETTALAVALIGCLSLIIRRRRC